MAVLSVTLNNKSFYVLFCIIKGLYSVVGPVYVSEMSPSHIRGKLGLANYVLTGGGVVCGAVANGLFIIDTQHAYTYGWRFDSHVVNLGVYTVLTLSIEMHIHKECKRHIRAYVITLVIV